VWSSGAIITDLGDGILNLEFNQKMNTIGGDVCKPSKQSIYLRKNIKVLLETKQQISLWVLISE
jgi:hypothetical protein